MASLAFFIHFFGGSPGRIEDQASVAVLRVFLTGAMTALAGRALAFSYHRLPAVRIVGKVLDYLFVAGGADGCIHKIGGERNRGLTASWIGFAGLGGHRRGVEHQRAEQEHATGSQIRYPSASHADHLLHNRRRTIYRKESPKIHCGWGLSPTLCEGCAGGGPPAGWTVYGSGLTWPR